MILRWWERYPGLLDLELDELEKAGIRHRVDQHAKKVEGRIVIDADAPVPGGGLLPVTCVFPDTYPFFRPEVFADGIKLHRHQHPTEKNLCLLPQTELGEVMPWNVDDTLALLLVEQLPKIFGRAGTPSAPTTNAAHEEVDQGEPYAEYFPTNDSMVVIDGAVHVPPEVMRGTIELAICARYGDDAREVLGAMLEVKDEQRSVVATAGPAITKWARSMKRLSVPWMRVHVPGDPLDALGSTHRPPKYGFSWHEVNGHALWVSAVLFQEEVERGVTTDGWFLAMTKKMAQPGKNGVSALVPWPTVRVARAGEDDLFARIPELRFMRACKIGVVGLGGIGAPSAMEFARCGVQELRLLDRDFVDPGTAVRWPRGFSAAGLVKPRALADIIATDYPYTAVKMFTHRIGVAPRRVADAPREHDTLSDFFDGLDLIYDASGDLAVENFLCTIGRERAIPLVRVSTTNGAWGGLCARFYPHRDSPCTHCLFRAMKEKTIPLAAEAPDSGFQPRGCRSKTFTGAGVDVTEVALNGTRLALATLSELKGGAYPKAPGDVFVINYRDRASGALMWPIDSNWYALRKHAACEQHA